MNDLLARLARVAGVGHELASRIDAVEWHWARPWGGWGGLLLLVPLGWWISRRHEQRLPWLAPHLRRALDVCRIAAATCSITRRRAGEGRSGGGSGDDLEVRRR